MIKHEQFSRWILLLLLLPLGCAAQKPKPADFGIKSTKALNAYLDAKQQEQYRDYKKAVEYYDEAIALEPEFGDAYLNKGACLYSLHKYKEAIPALEKSRDLMRVPNPMMWYMLAECHFNTNDYASASENYSKFFASNPRVPINVIETAKLHQKNSAFAAEAMKNPVKFDPVNMGESINSVGEEYLPCLTADESTIFFTSRRSENMGGYNAEYRDYLEDFYFSEFRDGAWKPAANLGAPVNTVQNEGAACFTPDGQYVYFTACERNGGYGNCDIYVSKLEGTKWSPPVNLGPAINTTAWESQPCISQDGNTLFFASSRAGGKGGDDIWYAEKVNGQWQPAVNMGDVINTPGTENSPFLHSDGVTFYFSSDYHPGMGKMDLFLSRKGDKGWGKPENLGYPLNSAAYESAIFVNAKGTTAYMNSTRDGGVGKGDLYYFELDPKIQPRYATFVRGFVREKGTSKALNAYVTFVNLATGDTIRSVQTNNASGKFLLTLPTEQDYAAFVDSRGYMFDSRNFTLRGGALDRNTYFDLIIELDPIRERATTVLRNVFFDTAQWTLKPESHAELDHLIQFLKLNSKVRIEVGGHTDDVGSDQDNQVLSERRAAEVKAYLVKGGIAESRLVAKGYGESKPISKEDRSLNRRTEFVILGTQ
jgi:outer membrane protein OmpA-like peptidoglycan-associated protein